MGNDGKREKRPFGFLKTTVLGALLVVVPVGIVAFALWHVAMLFKALLGPIFTHLPFDFYIVPRERVFPAEASMHDTIETLTMFGEGAAKLVAAK